MRNIRFSPVRFHAGAWLYRAGAERAEMFSATAVGLLLYRTYRVQAPGYERVGYSVTAQAVADIKRARREPVWAKTPITIASPATCAVQFRHRAGLVFGAEEYRKRARWLAADSSLQRAFAVLRVVDAALMGDLT